MAEAQRGREAGSAQAEALEASANVDPVEVVGPKGRVTLGALALPGVIACLHTLEAEDVEALGEHCVLLAHVAARACQAGLVILDFLHQDLITIGNHVRLLCSLQLPAQP